MNSFFSQSPLHDVGIAVFLNAGDPPLEQLLHLALLLDSSGVDCLELAVPFPDSVTDGPTVRRSAVRALQRGDVALSDVIWHVNRIRPLLRRLRIVLLLDWAYTVRPRGLQTTLQVVAESAADAILIHALPPRFRRDFYDMSEAFGLPVVTSCYAEFTGRDQIRGDGPRLCLPLSCRSLRTYGIRAGGRLQTTLRCHSRSA